MGVQTTTNWAKAMAPGIKKWYQTEYDALESQWPQIFEKQPSERAYEEEAGVTGYGLFQVKNEGGPISYGEQRQGFVKRYQPTVYALGFIITRETYEDNLYPQLGLRNAKSLAFSLNQTKEVVAANVLNRAFNSSYTGADGKELCATDHPNKSGGTWANELSTAADISESALEQACIDIGEFETDSGLLIAIKPKKLIVPPEGEFDAVRLLRTVQQPGTANNDVNAIKTTGKIPGGVVVNNFLTDADAWFIQTDCPDGMKAVVRREDEFGLDNDFDTENAKFKATFRYDWGWTDPRCMFGSPGA